MLKVVVNTNKVIASLLRNGKARRLLFHLALEVLLPKYVLEEINEHRKYLEEKVPPKSNRPSPLKNLEEEQDNRTQRTK